jgi:hypothetical protein
MNSRRSGMWSWASRQSTCEFWVSDTGKSAILSEGRAGVSDPPSQKPIVIARRAKRSVAIQLNDRKPIEIFNR